MSDENEENPTPETPPTTPEAIEIEQQPPPPPAWEIAINQFREEINGRLEALTPKEEQENKNNGTTQEEPKPATAAKPKRRGLRFKRRK
jgi:hypothetical protein